VSHARLLSVGGTTMAADEERDAADGDAMKAWREPRLCAFGATAADGI